MWTLIVSSGVYPYIVLYMLMSVIVLSKWNARE